jgi:vacuolar-type H+-ATPase subunit C/Vma6
MTAFLGKSLLYCYILTGLLLKTQPVKEAFHPLHVSTTDLSYNAKDSQMEIICTIFTDDFEAAIEKQFNSKADLSRPDMHAAMDVLVKKYVNSHLQLKTNGILQPLTYIGFEINREAVNVYLETGKVSQPKKMEAQVTLLQNLYDDQLNIVHMTVNGTRKSTRLDAPVKTASQEF